MLTLCALIPLHLGLLFNHLLGSLKSPFVNHGPRTQVVLQALRAFRAIDEKKVASVIIEPDTGQGMSTQRSSTWAILVFWWGIQNRLSGVFSRLCASGHYSGLQIADTCVIFRLARPQIAGGRHSLAVFWEFPPWTASELGPAGTHG